MCSTRERLASTLRERRKELGLSLRRAAEHAQIGPSTLSRWEAGSSVPMVPELESLLKALYMSTEDIRRILVSIDAPRAMRAAQAAGLDFKVPTGGDLLRILRLRGQKTIPEVAEELGVSASSVSRWERSEIHPSADTLDFYVKSFGATEEETQAILTSGVGKIRITRPEYDPSKYQSQIDSISASLGTGGEVNTEFQLLSMQSNLWWDRDQSGAQGLLREVCAMYGRYLLGWLRFPEALRQTEMAIESGDPFDRAGLEALRVQGCCAALRGQVIRPHLGLYTLQTCLQRATDSSQITRVLINMSDLSMLAGRPTEAESYATRAVSMAEQEALATQNDAEAALLASQGRIEDLRSRNDGTIESSAFGFREILLMAPGQSIETSLKRYEELISAAHAKGQRWAVQQFEFAHRLSQSNVSLAA